MFSGREGSRQRQCLHAARSRYQHAAGAGVQHCGRGEGPVQGNGCERSTVVAARKQVAGLAGQQDAALGVHGRGRVLLDLRCLEDEAGFLAQLGALADIYV